MPSLPTRSQQTIVQAIVTGIQGRASQLIDFGEGSPLRAIAEGFTGVFLWFQAMVLQLLASTRLATSTGGDVDSFVADYMPVIPGTSSPRLGPQTASGYVIVSVATPGPSSSFVPAGTTFKTGDGSQSFTVTADPSNPLYSVALGGYTLPANTGSMTIPVQANVAGSAGNVAQGAISVITSSLTGIDAVTNPAAFTNGSDGESDSSLKGRFAAYMLGLSRGDLYGTEYAIESAEANVQWQLVEYYDYAGNWRPGYYYIVCDDGSGSPSQPYVQAITNAAFAVRPLANQCSVFPPVVNFVAIALQITAAAGYDKNVLIGLVATAIQNNVNTLGLGNGLDFSILSAWAYSVTGVSGVSALTLNGLSGDAASLAANPKITIKTNNVTVS